MREDVRKRICIICTCVIFILFISIPFLSVFLVGIFLPAQYDQTYYGELSHMYDRIKKVENRKKIIVVGNSNVAFGVDSALAESLLQDAGLDYAVCNFGLYGSLGTKMMLEIVDDLVGKEDIVIFAPELNSQALSLYFSGEEAWYALDGNMRMFSCFSSDIKEQLLGNFFGYTAKKYALYTRGKKAEGSGVYATSSFDENCDLKNFSRPYNILPNLVDSNNPLSFDLSQFGAGFVSYVNEWSVNLSKKGVETYYSFSPMNRAAFLEGTAEASSFYEFVVESFDFPVISDIEDYIMDAEWFYDSNLHLNEYGMTVRTVNLVNDLKAQLGNNTKTQVTLPDKPAVPDAGIEGEGDNSCADCFTYKLEKGYYTITGLTEKGQSAQNLIIPYQVDGVYVKTVNADVFVENKIIESVTLQENITLLTDGSFFGCDQLTRIILCHEAPADISVGYGLFNGVSESCKVYAPKEGVSKFENDYFWGRYAKRLQGYDKK